MDVPTVSRCLRRIRDTQTQTNLKSRQRRDNVRGAFAADDAVRLPV
jgi:predicted amidophosphoribosyltransferase